MRLHLRLHSGREKRSKLASATNTTGADIASWPKNVVEITQSGRLNIVHRVENGW
jgi:hypothetical protein